MCRHSSAAKLLTHIGIEHLLMRPSWKICFPGLNSVKVGHDLMTMGKMLAPRRYQLRTTGLNNICFIRGSKPSLDHRVMHRWTSAFFFPAQRWPCSAVECSPSPGSLMCLLSLSLALSPNKHHGDCWCLMDWIYCLVRTGKESLQSLSGWPTKWSFRIPSPLFLFSSFPAAVPSLCFYQ